MNSLSISKQSEGQCRTAFNEKLFAFPATSVFSNLSSNFQAISGCQRLALVTIFFDTLQQLQLPALLLMDSPPEINDRQRAFVQLLEQHHRGLFTFVYSLVQHHADAEDVYQQAALVLWKKFDEFELGTNFGAWAAQVARNTARDFLKSKRRRGPCLSEEFLELMNSAYLNLNRDASFFTDRAEALENCLKKLRTRDRDLVQLCYAPGRDFSQIAKDRNRSIDAIYQAISRIRKNLAQCVQRSLSSER